MNAADMCKTLKNVSQYKETFFVRLVYHAAENLQPVILS
jgi:hypothetical protein